MTLRKLQENELRIIIDLTKRIWPVAYSEILSKAQLDYMIDLFYNESALLDLIQNKKHVFYIASDKTEQPVGFVSFELNALPQQTKLHKLYVLPELQGKGVGKQLLHFVMETAKQNKQEKLFLNVNKKNKAETFYKSLGFNLLKEEVIPIGNGYVMDDYVMEISINQ
jgi:ribosomal protein S18 acetylase RimI-like enzyme